MQQKIIVPLLANPHSHLREGPVLPFLVRAAVKGLMSLIAFMPNTQKGLKTAKEVIEYMKLVMMVIEEASIPWKVDVIPIVMITEETTEEEIDECIEVGIFDAKIYPLDRTTKSHNGVREYSRLINIVGYAGRRGMRIHFHPEHPLMEIIGRDAEYLFLPIVDMFMNETEAVIVWEHGTDARCIPFWEDWAESGRFYVTLTAHHLAVNEDDVFGDVRAVCKPPIKTMYDRRGLILLIEKDYHWVMAGLDDAPHDVKAKQIPVGSCSCGAYTSKHGLELYAHALDHLLPDNIQTFINFTSVNARKLYGFEDPGTRAELVRASNKIPEIYELGPWKVMPFWAGQDINWQARLVS